MSHTPGPWKYKQVGTLADYDIRDEKNYPLAWVEHSQIHDTAANARLIAAAPMMLVALEDMLKVIQENTGEIGVLKRRWLEITIEQALDQAGE